MPYLVEAQSLVKHYQVANKLVRAVDGVSISIAAGETLGLVGESGSGKSTVGKLLLRLLALTAGTIQFGGCDITTLGGEPLKAMRKEMQMIFQDPYASLNPRMTVEEIIAEPLVIHNIGSRAYKREKVHSLLELVGLGNPFLARYPHEMSGGQRQRVGIARALALEPKFVVCDEPVSALDVTTQEQVLGLLRDLKERLCMTYLFISHDLTIVRSLADRVVVMYLGHIVECAPTPKLYSLPRHPYTQALLSAIPVPDPKVERSRLRVLLPGEPPSPFNPPRGCVFHPRCSKAQAICRDQAPPLKMLEDGHQVACHLY